MKLKENKMNEQEIINLLKQKLSIYINETCIGSNHIKVIKIELLLDDEVISEDWIEYPEE